MMIKVYIGAKNMRISKSTFPFNRNCMHASSESIFDITYRSVQVGTTIFQITRRCKTIN